MENYLVYKHTCPDGKSYIGITSNYENRCFQHQKSKSCRAFSEAVMFFGWDNIKHEILMENLSKDDALSYESNLIHSYKTLLPNGYNMKVRSANLEEKYALKKEIKNRVVTASNNNQNKTAIKKSGRMTKKDVIKHFGGYSNAARLATKYGKPISPQAIRQWNDGEIDVLWAAFFYLIQQKQQLSIDMVFKSTGIDNEQ